MSRDSLVEKYNERHEGVDYFYTTCHNNGCWDATCLIKCGIKDGKVVSIEPDDSVNAGIAREDDDENAVQTGMLQARACPMGHAWRQELYSENRLLYPMKRVGEKGSGRGHFERISWDEALDTIAEKMRVMAKENPDHPWLYYCYYVAFEKLRLPVRVVHAGHHHRLGRPLHFRQCRRRRLPSGRSPDGLPDQGHVRRLPRLRGA